MGVSTIRSSRPVYASGHRRWPLVALALGSTSCVPLAAENAPVAIAGIPDTPAAIAPVHPATRAVPAPLLPAASPAFASPFRARTSLDQLRSLDCLAQAIFYEAASESEEGQRAVAQVVLNRVRHPAWPNSVCGVVYQGPMRAGGGCQFTFTCDGSLARRASGSAWERARRFAAEALAGRVDTGVGLSTHYHTHAVAPSWGPRLTRTAVIGAHIFYRLPGHAGRPAAFAAAYSGSEPLPRPTFLAPRTRTAELLVPSAAPATEKAVQEAMRLAPNVGTGTDVLPPSTIREEYRHSGQWRADAPVSITGR